MISNFILALLLVSSTIQSVTSTFNPININIETNKPLVDVLSQPEENLTKNLLLQSDLLTPNHEGQHPSDDSSSEGKISDKYQSRILSEENTTEGSNVLNSLLQGFSLSSLLLQIFLEPNKLSSVFTISLVNSQDYVKYINASLSSSVPGNLDVILSPFSITNTLAFQAPEDLQDLFPKLNIDPVFANRGLHSSYIVNQWALILTFIIFFILWAVTYQLEKTSKKYQRKALDVLVKRLRILMRWNLFLLLILTSYDKLTLFSLLQFEYLDWTSAGSILSFIICITVTGVALFIFGKIFAVSILAQKKKKYLEKSSSITPPTSLEKKLDPFKVIFTDYKDKSLLHQSYLFICSFRTIYCFIVVGAFPTYPIMQVLMILIANSCIVYYVAVEKPLKNVIVSKLTLFFEICFLFLNVCLISAVMNGQFFQTGIAFQEHITYIIMITKLIIGLCSHVFMWIQTGMTVRTLYKAVKSATPNTKVTWKKILEYLGEHIDLTSEAKSEGKKDEPVSASKAKCPLILIHHPDEDTTPTTISQSPDKVSPKKGDSPKKSQGKLIQITLDSDFDTQDNLLVTAPSQTSIKNTSMLSFAENPGTPSNMTAKNQSLWHRRVSRNSVLKSAIASHITSIIEEEQSMGSLDSGRKTSARGQPKEERDSVNLLQNEDVQSLFARRNLSRLSIEKIKEKEGGLLSISIDDATKRPSTKGTQSLESPTPTASLGFGESWYSRFLGDSPKNGGLKSAMDPQLAPQGGETNKETQLSRNRSTETVSRRRSFRRAILSRDIQSRDVLGENILRIPIASENENSLSLDIGQTSPKAGTPSPTNESYSLSMEMDKSESQNRPLKNFRSRWQHMAKQNI